MSVARARSILIVEDEAVVAEDLQESLAELGYDAFAIAASSDEALRQVVERCPDLVLMDIRIQGTRDGIETAATLRATHDVPIVYLTAHADDATIARAKITGPYGYLVKPVKAGELRSAIELALHRRDSERAQRQLQRQFEHADRLASLGTLTGGLAHEINTPLAVVIATSELLRVEIAELDRAMRAGQLTSADLIARIAEVGELQAEVSTAGSRIAKIVADLRVFARAGEPTSADADVGRAIRWALRTTAHELRHRARLVHDIGALPPVRGDEARLGQVFVNLVKNAAQSIPPGLCAYHEVAVHARLQQERVIVEVRDTGCGIAPEHLPRIFEPFFTTHEIGEGTGLGLAVCHGIVTSLGGEIEVDSDLGRGSTFRVVLRALPQPVPSSPAPPPSIVAPRARILVVDDDEMIQRVMKRLLRDHDVTCVASGSQALALLADDARFDVILSDVTMPVMTGVEFYRELAARSPALARRLVFVTGGARAATGAEEFLRSVPNVTLEKPFGQLELESVVASMLASEPRS
jgi:signal transduction histidine kinase